MIVYARDENIGDSLVCTPALERLRAKHPDCSIYVENHDVCAIMPESIRAYPAPANPVAMGGEPDIILGIWDAVQKYGRDIHPIESLIQLAGFEKPSALPKLNVQLRPFAEIEVAHALGFDILLAPWSKDPARGLTEAEATELVEILINTYPEDTIGILGGKDDPHLIAEPLVGGFDWPWEYLYGAALDVVVAAMRKAKLVITTDSANNRLAHAAGTPHHVLLATSLTPQVWQSHPGVHLVQGNPGAWRTETIFRAIEGARSAA